MISRSEHLDEIAGQPHEALDVVDPRIRRVAENDDVATSRRADIDELLVDYRQPQAVGELVLDDEIAVEHVGIIESEGIRKGSKRESARR